MMKLICLLYLFFSFTTSIFACTCGNVFSVCSRINNPEFQENGLIWIGEFTGNIFEFTEYGYYFFDYNVPDTIPYYSALEVKVGEILHGTINKQNSIVQNTDSTVWIVLGSSSSCYQSRFGIENNIPYLMLSNPTSNIESMNILENSYALYSCTPDLIPYRDQLEAPFYRDIDGVGLSDIDPLYGETIAAEELTQFIETCMSLPCTDSPREGYFDCE